MATSKRILVIDDDQTIREMFEKVLNRIGHVAVLAVSGQDGIDKFNSDEIGFDLVITDLTLTDMSGDIVASIISDTAPVVICTGHAVDASCYPCKAVLKKPFTVDEVIAVIERLT